MFRVHLVILGKSRLKGSMPRRLTLVAMNLKDSTPKRKNWWPRYQSTRKMFIRITTRFIKSQMTSLVAHQSWKWTRGPCWMPTTNFWWPIATYSEGSGGGAKDRASAFCPSKLSLNTRTDLAFLRNAISIFSLSVKLFLKYLSYKSTYSLFFFPVFRHLK